MPILKYDDPRLVALRTEEKRKSLEPLIASILKITTFQTIRVDYTRQLFPVRTNPIDPESIGIYLDPGVIWEMEHVHKWIVGYVEFTGPDLESGNYRNYIAFTQAGVEAFIGPEPETKKEGS